MKEYLINNPLQSAISVDSEFMIMYIPLFSQTEGEFLFPASCIAT